MKIVTIYEAMKITGLSYKQIYYAIAVAKKIKARQINRVWIINERDLGKLGSLTTEKR